MPPQKLKKLKPLKTKVKAHNTSILMSPVPVGSPDEQQAPDASAAPAVAKKKGKKITLRELPHEGAGLAANRPPPRADLDSIYVPAKPWRRESLGGMTGNLSPLARLSRVCSGPVASRCARTAPPPAPGSLTGRTNRPRVRAGSTRCRQWTSV